MQDQLIEWRAVPDCGGAYEVSSAGEIRSRWNPGNHRICDKWRILRPSIGAVGYPVINLFVSGARRQAYVHRLVALAFLGVPPAPHYEVNHIDGDKTNARAGNLEWVEPSANVRHAVRTGLSPSGSRHVRAKLTPEDVATIRAASGTIRQSELAAHYGVSQATISNVINRHKYATP